MINFKATICTGSEGLNGEKISKELLKKISDEATGLPVNFNFCHELPMGFVEACIYDESLGKVTADLILNEKVIPDRISSYIVPSLRIKKSHKEGEIIVIDDAEIMDLGLTLYPSDVSLKPLEKKE